MTQGPYWEAYDCCKLQERENNPLSQEVAWGVSGMRELKVIGFGHWLDVNSPSLEEGLVHPFSLNLQVI